MKTAEEIAFDHGDEILAKYAEFCNYLFEQANQNALPLDHEQISSGGLVLLSFWYEGREDLTEEEVVDSYMKLHKAIFHALKNKERYSTQN